jgi:hypothetical protein
MNVNTETFGTRWAFSSLNQQAANPLYGADLNWRQGLHGKKQVFSRMTV